MKLSQVRALVLSALPLATAYTELLNSKLRSPWPVNSSSDLREVHFCYADAETRADLKKPFEDGLILWEKALGQPGPEQQHGLKFRETVAWHNNAYDYSSPLYCYEDKSYYGYGTGGWNEPAVKGWTLAVHAQKNKGAMASQSDFTPDSSDAHWNIAGRHSLRIGPDPDPVPETKGNLTQPCRIAHELGHILGMMDEHQRYDRDDWIYVFCTNIHDYPAAFDRVIKDPNNKQIPPAQVDWYLCNNEIFWDDYHFNDSMRAFVKGAGFHPWDNRVTSDEVGKGKAGPDFDSIMMPESSYLAGAGCVSTSKATGKIASLDITRCSMMMSYRDTNGQHIYGGMTSRKKPSKRDVLFVQKFYPWNNEKWAAVRQ